VVGAMRRRWRQLEVTHEHGQRDRVAAKTEIAHDSAIAGGQRSG
jgi:hypothetical protein